MPWVVYTKSGSQSSYISIFIITAFDTRLQNYTGKALKELPWQLNHKSFELNKLA